MNQGSASVVVLVDNNGNSNRPVSGQSPFTNNRQQEQSKGFAGTGVLSTGKNNSKGTVDVRGIINLPTPQEGKLAKKHDVARKRKRWKSN